MDTCSEKIAADTKTSFIGYVFIYKAFEVKSISGKTTGDFIGI